MGYEKQAKYVGIAGFAAAGLIATAALAGDGPTGHGVTADTPLVTAELVSDIQENHDKVKIQTKDPTVVRVQKLTFAAGGHSGWHHHPGIIIVAVQSGTVSLKDSNCVTKDYGPGLPNGAVFVEGHDSPQEASSADGAVTYVTYVVPLSNPSLTRFRVNDTTPFCARTF